MRLIDRMLPVDEWPPDDKAEMEAMLKKRVRAMKTRRSRRRLYKISATPTLPQRLENRSG
jgi:hypothetical protein